jgi:hypothetical protein
MPSFSKVFVRFIESDCSFAQVYSKFGDTSLHVGVPQTTRRTRSGPHDPIAEENSGLVLSLIVVCVFVEPDVHRRHTQGPSYMSTEAHSKFVPKPIYPHDLEKGVRPIGPPQNSGAASNTEQDPITYRPPSAHDSPV